MLVYIHTVGCGKMFLHQVPSLDKALTTGSSLEPAMAMPITMPQNRSRMRRHGSLLTRLSPGGLEVRSGTCWTDCCGGHPTFVPLIYCPLSPVDKQRMPFTLWRTRFRKVRNLSEQHSSQLRTAATTIRRTIPKNTFKAWKG